MGSVKESISVAVIGCGHWGKNIVRVLVELGVLGVACDTRPEALENIVKQFPGIQTTRDYTAVLKDPTVDAVAIATPAVTHANLARQALQHGKDVFVEKPLALTVEEGQRLVDLAESQGRILMVGHLLNYHPAVVHLKRLIHEGALGRIHYLYSNRLNLGKFRTEENVLWSFAPHDVSVMLSLLNEMPSRVYAEGGSFLNPHIPDVTLTTLEFASGVKAHIFVSWLHPYKEHRLVVVGSEGMAVFNDTEPERKLQLLRQPVAWRALQPVPCPNEAEVIPVPSDEPLRNECLHFLQCMRTRQTPLTDGREGLCVLQVLEECQRSLSASVSKTKSATPTTSYFAHETAVIDEPCQIGEGTKIWHFTHLMPHAQVGRNCNIGQNVFIASHVKVGNNVKIQNNVSLYEGVILEDDVFCGPSVVFTNVVNPRSHVSRKAEYRQTLVRKGATLGANSTLVCGITIGRYAFVGAGAVVTKDVPDYGLVLGVPARLVGWMCQCGVRLPFGVDEALEQARCKHCGTVYQRRGMKVEEVPTE